MVFPFSAEKKLIWNNENYFTVLSELQKQNYLKNIVYEEKFEIKFRYLFVQYFLELTTNTAAKQANF